MSKSVTFWKFDGYTLFGDAESPYYLMGFDRRPSISSEPLVLKTGDVLYPGDTLAYLGGHKTSAAHKSLYPVEPFLFRYAGRYVDHDHQYALWESGFDGNEEFETLYYSHSIVEEEGVVKSLFYTNRACSGRVIEADIFYATHESIDLEKCG